MLELLKVTVRDYFWIILIVFLMIVGFIAAVNVVATQYVNTLMRQQTPVISVVHEEQIIKSCPSRFVLEHEGDPTCTRVTTNTTD